MWLQESEHYDQLTDAVGALVVAGDGDVDVARGRVHVGEGDHRDVGVRALRHRLVVGAWVGHHQEAGLAEGGLQVDGIQIIT